MKIIFIKLMHVTKMLFIFKMQKRLFLTISSYVTKYRLFYEAFMVLLKCLVTHIAERFFRDLTAPEMEVVL